MFVKHESTHASEANDGVWNDRATRWPLFFAVIAPIVCVILNVPSLCGPRAFDLAGAAETWSPLFLAFGVIGCITMAWSLVPSWFSRRTVGHLLGALLSAILASTSALLLLLPNVIAMILFPPALLIGCLPYISVALWLVRSRTLLGMIQSKYLRRVGRWMGEGAGVSIGIALAVQIVAYVLVTQATHTLVDGDLNRAPLATAVLRTAVWCDDVCREPLRRAYHTSHDPARQQALRDVYQQLEGNEIDTLDVPGGCF